MVYPHMIPPKAPTEPVSSGVGTGIGSTASGTLAQSTTIRGRGDGTSGSVDRSGGPLGLGAVVSTAGVALKAERYEPKIFGFHVHEISKLQRWQGAMRDKYVHYL